MLPKLNALALLAGLAYLLAACSARRPALLHPIPPQRGVPINVAGARHYLGLEGPKLLTQDKLTTNLLHQVCATCCALQPVPPSPRALSGPELAERLEMAVAVVGRVVRFGKDLDVVQPDTGFFLTESGALVTCRRPLLDRQALGLVVMTRDGRLYPVREVLAAATNSDLVILQVAGQGFTPLPVAATAQQGEPVWVMSHPHFNFYTLTSGIVSDYASTSTAQGQRTLLNITADFGVGSLGAPVVNQSGAVVGIAHPAAPPQLYPEGDARRIHQLPDRSCIPSSVLLDLMGQPHASTAF